MMQQFLYLCCKLSNWKNYQQIQNLKDISTPRKCCYPAQIRIQIQNRKEICIPRKCCHSVKYIISLLIQTQRKPYIPISLNKVFSQMYRDTSAYSDTELFSIHLVVIVASRPIGGGWCCVWWRRRPISRRGGSIWGPCCPVYLGARIVDNIVK